MLFIALVFYSISPISRNDDSIVSQFLSWKNFRGITYHLLLRVLRLLLFDLFALEVAVEAKLNAVLVPVAASGAPNAGAAPGAGVPNVEAAGAGDVAGAGAAPNKDVPGAGAAAGVPNKLVPGAGADPNAGFAPNVEVEEDVPNEPNILPPGAGAAGDGAPKAEVVEGAGAPGCPGASPGTVWIIFILNSLSNCSCRSRSAWSAISKTLSPFS